MRKPDNLYHLEGIKTHIDALKSYTPETKEALLKDSTLQDAIQMRLIALGEEVAKLSDEFKQKYPAIPWHKMAGLRNIIAHDYFAVSLNTVWELLTMGPLDDLEKFINKQLAE